MCPRPPPSFSLFSPSSYKITQKNSKEQMDKRGEVTEEKVEAPLTDESENEAEH